MLRFDILAFISVVAIFSNGLKLSTAIDRKFASVAALVRPSSNGTTPQAIAQDRDLDALKQTIYDRINEYRASNNLPLLELNSTISQQAEIHSEKMARGKVPFSHQGFEQRIEAINTEIAYRRAAENIAYNSGYENPAERAVSGWIDSTNHRKNILGNYNLTGIGIAKNQQGEYYFTQLFILEN